MKVRSITGFMNEIPMKQFVAIERAKTPMGLLLIALVAETTWSSEYEVCGYWGEKPILEIHHPAFLPDQPLMIDDKSGIVSVRGVEDALREHFRIAQKKVEAKISPLQKQGHALYHASCNIDICKAKAAIVAVFPEAAAAEHLSHVSDGSLIGFVVNNCGRESIFVAREIDHEFVGGVARLNRDRLEWWGFNSHQRHDLFWKSLARAFAARELQIPEDQLQNGLVASKEKPQETWTSDPHFDLYVVERVMFELPNGPLVDVEFGPNNLPANVTPVPRLQVA